MVGASDSSSTHRFPAKRSISQCALSTSTSAATIRDFYGGVDKYFRGDAPYVIEETTATDEDGRKIEVMTVHQLLRTKKVGEKWA